MGDEANLEEQKKMLIRELKMMGIEDEKVLEAIRETKREIFVPEEHGEHAYANYPQPIGQGQTISQPYTVAKMLELLEIRPGSKILEVGSGSGYNAAVMSKLVGEDGEIISLEIIKKLSEKAKENLKEAGIENVKVIFKDGYTGYEKESPYDRVIVTAAAEGVPDQLLSQLKMNGIMVAPISRDHRQVMTKMVKKHDEPITTTHGSFRFVPIRRVKKE